MKEMTYVKALTYVLENVTDLPADVTERLTALKEQTAKRNTATKPTAKQMANLGLADRIKAVLSVADHPLTASEIMAGDDVLAVLSNQKVSAIIKILLKEGQVIRILEKRVAKFKLAD